jgi:hypothetical protein
MEMDAVQREQLAAQIVAVMQSAFARPSPTEMRHIMRLADEQITAQEITASQAVRS